MPYATRFESTRQAAICRLVSFPVLLSACAADHIAGPTRPPLPGPLAASVRPCGAEPGFFAGTPLADREAWYGKQLRAMNEQRLCADSSYILESYRFTWIPSFHPAVVVRIDLTPTGYRLTGKILTGAGGYEPGSLAKQITRPLSEAEFGRFSELLRSAQFWELPTNLPLFGCDGTQWILEVLSSKGYHVVDRWTPYEEGPNRRFRAVGEWLLASSDLVPATLVKGY